MIHWKREAGSLQKLLLVLGIAAMTACSSQHKEEGGNADNTATNQDGGAQAPDYAKPEGTEAPNRDELMAGYLKAADAQIAENRLADARATLLTALSLDATNATAQAKLKEVNDKLGQPSSNQDIVDQTVVYKQSQREKKVAEVRDHLVQAQNYFNEGKYKEAKLELDLAQLTIKYDPVQTDYGALPSEVAGFMAQVQNALDTQAAIQEQKDYTAAKNAIQDEEDKERRQRAETIRALMTEGVNAYNRQDFDASERLGEQVLALAPSFGKAQELVESSRAARNASWRKALYEARREQFQRWMEQVREAQIPWHDLIRFPDRRQWDELKKKRRPVDNVASAAQDSDTVATIKNQLENIRVTWSFKDQALRDVVQYIRDTQGLNIIFSKGAGADKGDTQITYEVRDLKFATALKLLLEPQELVYTFRYDLLYIAKKDEALGNLFPKVYEVRDLTIPLANFSPPKLHLRPGPAGDASQQAVFGAETDPTNNLPADQLLDLVKENVARGSWEGERSLQLSANQLVAVTTPEVHQEIDNFLENLRRFSKIIVHVETRFISIREGFLSEFGIDFRGTGGANPGQIANLDDVTNGADDNASAGLDNGQSGVPLSAAQSPSSGFYFNDRGEQEYRGRSENVFTRALGGFLSPTGGITAGITFLDDVEVSMIVRAVEKSTHASTLTAPRLTIYNNQRSNITIVNQVTYVKDYDVEVAQTAYIADPLVDIVQDGLVLDVKPTVHHDRKFVTLEVRPTIATLNRPIQTFVTPLAGLTTNVIIELPEIRYSSAQTTVVVPDDGYLVIGGLKDVSTIDRRSETPILSQIPILSFFFSKKGRSDEIADLMIILHVKIIDMAEEEANLTK